MYHGDSNNNGGANYDNDNVTRSHAITNTQPDTTPNAQPYTKPDTEPNTSPHARSNAQPDSSNIHHHGIQWW
jgi:hypothetical protein